MKGHWNPLTFPLCAIVDNYYVKIDSLSNERSRTSYFQRTTFNRSPSIENLNYIYFLVEVAIGKVYSILNTQTIYIYRELEQEH